MTLCDQWSVIETFKPNFSTALQVTILKPKPCYVTGGGGMVASDWCIYGDMPIK